MKLVKGVKGEACMCRKCGMVPATQTHRCPGKEPEWLREAREKLNSSVES